MAIEDGIWGGTDFWNGVPNSPGEDWVGRRTLGPGLLWSSLAPSGRQEGKETLL
jgi:hypothetical protein